MIAEEAYRQLTEIQHRDILSKSQDVRLKDWLDLMEEVCNRHPSKMILILSTGKFSRHVIFPHTHLKMILLSFEFTYYKLFLAILE